MGSAFCFVLFSRVAHGSPHYHHHRHPSPICSPRGELGGLGHDVLLGGLLLPCEFLKDPVLFLLVSALSLYPAPCSDGIRTPTLHLAV